MQETWIKKIWDKVLERSPHDLKDKLMPELYVLGANHTLKFILENYIEKGVPFDKKTLISLALESSAQLMEYHSIAIKKEEKRKANLKRTLDNRKKAQIKAAAIKTREGSVIALPPPARHDDCLEYAILTLEIDIGSDWEAGFVLSDGLFLTKGQALALVGVNGQKLIEPIHEYQIELNSTNLW